MSAFEVHQLTVAYQGETVLWNVDFTLDEGVIAGIIGPNGAGKSTLLRAATGIITPLSGRALFFGKPFAKVRKKVTFVPQRRDVDWNFPVTVLDVALMGRNSGRGIFSWATKADKLAAMEALEYMGLSQFASRQISQLSGGQQQRLFLTRALLQDADLLLLDEPFAGVDMASEAKIMETLFELKKKGKTVVIVHHDLHTAAAYFDKVLLLNVSLLGIGEPDKVLTPENLEKAYGASIALFGEASKRSHALKKGLDV